VMTAPAAQTLWLTAWQMPRGPLWSLGGAVAALLAAGPGRELALQPAYQPTSAADAAIHLASQLAGSVAHSGHDLASPTGEDLDAAEACVCRGERDRFARLILADTHLLAFLAGVLVWPLADLLRLLKLAWLRRLADAEARLLVQVRPPARP
jgi:hypothetical protein